jgi:PAS domain S-box-containing protein
LALAIVHPYATPVWAPTGIALAALLVFGCRSWAGVLVGAFLVNFSVAGDAAVSSAIAVGNTLEALLGACLVKRFAGGRRAFERPQGVFAFAVLAGLVSTTVSPTVGVTGLALTGLAQWADYGPVWFTWWLGDAAGALLVAPVLVLWVNTPSLRWDPRRGAEAVLLLIALVLVGLFAFDGRKWNDPLICLAIPLLMWAAFRFGQREAATAVMVLSGPALWGMLRGFGPFSRVSANESVLFLQVFMGVLAVTALTLAAAERQRRRAEEALREEGERLHLAQEAGRTGAWEWDIVSGKVFWSRGLEAIHGLAPGAFAGTLPTALERVHPEDRGRVDRALAHVVGGCAEDPVEYRILRPDGAVRWVEGRGRLARDAAGRPVRIRGVCVDVTERKQAHRLLAAQHAVALALTESATLHDAAPKVLRALGEGLQWEVGVCWWVDWPAGVLRCVDVWRAPSAEASPFAAARRREAFAPGVGLPGCVWTVGRPVWFPAAAPAGDRPGPPGAVGFPIGGGAEFLGVMEFFGREIRRPDDALLRMLAGVGNQIGQFVERRRAEKALHDRLREFDLARQIQHGFLPRAAPAPAGLAVGGASRPAQETGGDFFDYVTLADGGLALAVGDVSGHGIGAALLMAETCAYLRALALTHGDVARILALANRRLAADTDAGYFVALILARLAPGGRSLVYSNAGHWPGYVLDGRGDVKAVLSSTGTPLGLYPESEFPAAAPIPLAPGDLVFLPTDGVIESLSAVGERFGMHRALDVIRAHRGRPPEEIVEALFQAVAAHSSGAQLDDVTAVILKVDAPS